MILKLGLPVNPQHSGRRLQVFSPYFLESCRNPIQDDLPEVMSAMIKMHLSSEGSAQRFLEKAVFFIKLSNEGITILENATRFGLIISKKVRDIL